MSFSVDGKVVGNVVVGVIPVTEGVDGRNKVSRNDKVVSGEISIDDFTMLDLPGEKVWSI